MLEHVHTEVSFTLRPLASRKARDHRQEVEDLTQAVLVKLFEDDGNILRGWDPARGMSLRNFVALVTRRRVVRAMSGFRGNLWAVTPLSAELLEACPALQRDELEDVEHALELDQTLLKLKAWLSERGWRLFRMIYIDQRDIRDVGEAEDMTTEALHAWCSRLRKKAREFSSPPPARVQHGG